MRFPKRLKYRNRGRPLVTIYRSKKNKEFPFNCYWREANPDPARLTSKGKPAGNRRSNFKNFATYSAALKFGEAKVAELADVTSGKRAAVLSLEQATDALNAILTLQEHFVATGRRYKLGGAVQRFCDADSRLNGRSLSDVTDTFLATSVNVKRKDLKEAVELFITKRKAKAGSADYDNHSKLQLERFAEMFPNTAVSDLTREHVDKFFGTIAGFAPKTKSHYQAACRKFWKWAVKNDFLPVNHRLNEADGMEHQDTTPLEEIAIYTPREMAALLANADDTLRPVLAVGAFAGVRSQEMMRLHWADIFRIPGHIEISVGKAKTRQRRLIEIRDNLAQWLEPCRARTGKFWPGSGRSFLEYYVEACKSAKVERRKNALRHSYISHLFALTENENHVALMSGNSPQIIVKHYRKVVTKSEGQHYFGIAPERPANVIQLQDKAAI